MRRFGRLAVGIAAAALSAGAGGALAQNQCGGLIAAACLESLGAGAAPLPESDCGRQLAAYRSCLASAAAAAGPVGGGAGEGCSEARAARLWESAERAGDCVSYEGFRDACPNTPEARFAAAAMRRLSCAGVGAAAAPAAPTPDAAAAPAEAEGARRTALHRAIQTELARLGDYRSGIDGVWGSGSAAALRAFQRREGLSVDGAPSEAVLARLKTAAPWSRPAPTARARRPGETFRDCAGCPEMVVLPGGSFTMGSPAGEEGRDTDEGPQRAVRIAGFAMSAHEVAYRDWDACVAEGGCGGHRPGDEGWGRGERPALRVSWDDAQSYVRWLNGKVSGAPYRLPSEAEWEYAARAGSRTRFSWGDDWDPRRANGAGAKTVAVGSYASNAFGLHDMHGNALEWVQDCWNPSYSGAPADGAAWMSGDCAVAVLRGGSWKSEPKFLRSAVRRRFERGFQLNYVGFRVARTLGE